MAISELNPAQRDAATAGDGAVLVIAGAGTGKTQTLVHRVAWLVEQGVPPEQIVLLTFTRRAANEMLERASRMVGDRARKVRGGTFHAFAAQSLRIHGHHLGYTPRFTIFDTDDSERLVANVRAELGYAGKQRNFLRADALHKLWSLHRNTGRDVLDIVEQERPEQLDEVPHIERVMKAVDERRKKLDAMDYDDLLVRFGELLFDHEAPRKRISGGCRHVLVDEYQDTNRVQAQIAAGLMSEHGNLMAVGDEAQSIYAFRGATVRNILDFPEMMGGARIIKLEENYRSTTRILDLANGVLKSATEGFDKRLFSSLGEGAFPEVLDVDDEDAQAYEVARRIDAVWQAGAKLREICVLIRSGFHSNLLELELGKRKIPFEKFGGIRFVDAGHVKDSIAMFRTLANPRDELAWTRVLRTIEGVGETTAAKIAASAVEVGRLDATPYLKRKFGPALGLLADVLDAARDADDASRAKLLVDWYRPSLERLYDDGKRRERDLDTVELLAARAASLDDFLQGLALDPVEPAEDEDAEDEDKLVISTIHSAKGLEWRAVFILALRDGGFPSAYALEDPEQIEEEKRLLYVAVTRAREKLTLVRPAWIRSRAPTFDLGDGNTLLDQIDDFDDLVEAARRHSGGGGGNEGRGRMDRFRKWFDRG